MWTPRRILLSLLTFSILFGVYVSYNRLLGSFDGLPMLPTKFRKPQGSEITVPPIPRGGSSITDQLIIKAFGPGCPEERYPIKIYQRARGVILCSQTPKPIKGGPRDGWVEFTPLSVISIGRSKGPDGTPEMTTLFCDSAYVQFDKPIRSLSDQIDGRKIVTAELHSNPESEFKDPRIGRIRINHNRKSLDRNDDIEVITPGPIYYVDEPKPGDPDIYGHEVVQVTDHMNTDLEIPDRSRPRQPTTQGRGLQLYLIKEDAKTRAAKKGDGKSASPAPPTKKPGSTSRATVTGVDRIILMSEVAMNIWTEADTGIALPGADAKTPAKKGPNDPKGPTGGLKSISKYQEIDIPAVDTRPKDGQAVELPKFDPKLPVAPNPKTDPKADPKAPAPKLPAKPKKLLRITTAGKFIYEAQKDIAHFLKPEKPKPGVIEQVEVHRPGRMIGSDTLLSDYLDVFFMRTQQDDKKNGPPSAATTKKDDRSGGIKTEGDFEIKLVHAWGTQITLTSDSENLNAGGTDLEYDAILKRTVLKGTSAQPMYAVKDGNLIRAYELHLFGDGNEITQARAYGPGQAGLGDLNPKTGEFFKTAVWGEGMIYTKVEEFGKKLDLITFIGKRGISKAQFKDVSGEKPQMLDAQLIKVWLLPADTPDPKAPPKKSSVPAKKDGTDVAEKAKPFRLEAVDEVTGNSAELVIRRSDHLVVWFKDVAQLIKPPEPKKGPAKEPAKGNPKSDPIVGPKPDPKETVKLDPKGKDPAPKAKEPEKKPLLVTAKSIETWLNRDRDGQMEVDRVHAEIGVDIHQDPSGPDDQGTDIRGRTVDLKSFAEGNQLFVTGDETDPVNKKWGMVHFDKLTMYGFDIVIDQRLHTADVKGEGSMDILSATDFEGKKLDKPTKINVKWFQKMDFHGAEGHINYHGRVQAHQLNQRMKAEWMQVVLDRPVLLTQDRTANQQAKKDSKDNPQIDVVHCYHEPKDNANPPADTRPPVTVVEEVREGGTVVKMHTLSTPEMLVENKPSADSVSGKRVVATSSELIPGLVRLFQPGRKDDAGPLGSAPAKDPPKRPQPKLKPGELGPDEEMKLTVVQFAQKMIGDDARKKVTFYRDVKVAHIATDNPLLPVELRESAVPEGAMYMQCSQTLQIITITRMNRGPDGKPVEVNYHDMKAIGKVRVRKQGEFFGDAAMVTYSEEKGQLVFHGEPGIPAEVNKLKGIGVRPDTFRAAKIIYDVKTKAFQTEGGDSLSK